MQSKVVNQVNAGFFVRLAAYLVDSLIVGAALMVVRIPIWISSISNPDNIMVRDFIFSYSIADILYYLLTAIYFIMLTYKSGATIGKKVFHLRVVSREERNLTLFEVAFRETVGRFLSALILNVGYILVGTTGEKRGLHDMLSDTEVIYYHEEKVYVETPVYCSSSNDNGVYMAASYGMPVVKQEEENEVLVEEPAEEEKF